MFLKCLELQGFKSFPEKVKLEFKEGITAVVGPNGSGKSNISDALRWVLGEQSAKTLRGEKMEDVIFSGTENRKALGFAEVSMIIDNSDKKLNIDYNELTVTRRVYRSGESGYFINGSSCRLKDIHELFMDTGIGRDGYSIIGQGRIDAVLSSKSDDRRLLFEEAAGVVKFKNRKLQAENKLEETRKNLTRTNDIIAELEQRIAPMQKQAEKTKKYLELSENLKSIRISIFTEEYKKFENEADKISKNIAIVDTQIKDENLLCTENENKKNSLKIQLEQTEKIIEQTSAQTSELRLTTEQKNNDIKLIGNEIEHIKNDIKRNKSEIEKKAKEFEKNNSNSKLINSKLQAAKLELDAKKTELDKLNENFEKINSMLSQKEELIKKYNFDIVEKMKISSEAASQAALSETRLAGLKEQSVTAKEELYIYESRLNEKTIHLKACQNLMDDILKKEYDIEKKIEILTNSADKISSDLSDINHKHENSMLMLNESKSKHKILSELEKDYDGYTNSVKAILKQKDTNPDFKAVRGAVGELIRVEEKFETAVETALGAALNNIITEDEECAKKCISYLKLNKKGRATFLPKTSVKAKSLGEVKNKILNEYGVLGIADEIISFDDEFKGIMSNLLGRVIVASDIDCAVKIASKYNHSYKIVTLQGEILNPGGSMTGGSIFKKSGSIFSRTRELKQLEIAIDEKNKEIFEIEKSISILQNNYNKTNYEIEETKKLLYAANIEKAEKSADIQQAKKACDELKEKIDSLKKQQLQFAEELNKAALDANKHKAVSDKLSSEIEDLSSALGIYQDEIQNQRNFKEEELKKINSLKIKISSLQYEINGFDSDIKRILSENNTFKADMDYLKKDIEKRNAQCEFKLKETERFENEILNLKKMGEELNEKFDELNRKKNIIKKDIEEINNKIIEFTETIGKLNSEKIRLEGKIENIEAKSQRLCDSMWEDYEITYAKACTFEKSSMDYSSLKKAEAELKSSINQLGSINPDAIEQFREIKQRYDFNIKQRDDIIKADEDLKIIIKKLSEDMQAQFMDRFNTINKNFSAVFSEIFGGGSATLKLSDENNILTSGIEIAARPPGKKLQSLSLLSGGERTLTAVSLLFAIFKMKPSPFCILDETDAALDDANVIRYSNYLKKISDKNQFIVITHKTGTMEDANVLYGVTMQEQGVSKIISVKLT